MRWRWRSFATDEVELGVLGCPELTETRHDSEPPADAGGSLIVAVRGGGTWTQPLERIRPQWRRLDVSSRSQIAADARCLRSVEKAHTNTDEIGQLAATAGHHRSRRSRWIARQNTPCWRRARAMSCCGCFRRRGPTTAKRSGTRRPARSWSTEAGGRVTDLDGKPLDFSHGRTLAKNRGILATNGRLCTMPLSRLALRANRRIAPGLAAEPCVGANRRCRSIVSR